jgi:hypothetical protein|tara:strand:+ start:628 stop:1122 length:495 start_codon:yes stop_codon:yes gene_type:complete
VRIILTKTQREYADNVGIKRQAYNNSINKADAYGFKGDGTAIHVDGARAELAVALALSKDWADFAKDYDKIVADVGTNIQVRSTNYKHGNLLLHPKDRDDQVFVLVKSHDFPTMEVVGWVLGKDAKKKVYWEDGSQHKAFTGRPCYRYPHTKLNPMDSLEDTET